MENPDVEAARQYLLISQRGPYAGHYMWRRDKLVEPFGNNLFGVVRGYDLQAIRFENNYVTRDEKEVREIEKEIAACEKACTTACSGPVVILEIEGEIFEYFLHSPIQRSHARPLFDNFQHEVMLRVTKHKTRPNGPAPNVFYTPEIWVLGSRVRAYNDPNPCEEIEN